MLPPHSSNCLQIENSQEPIRPDNSRPQIQNRNHYCISTPVRVRLLATPARTTALDTRRDKRSVAIDEEATIADYELTLKCCGGKRFIKSGHNKFFVRKSKYCPYLLVLRFMNDPKTTDTNIACLQCKKKGPCSSIVEIQPMN